MVPVCALIVWDLSCFKSRAVWVAVETGLAVSAVLSTLERPTSVLSMVSQATA